LLCEAVGLAWLEYDLVHLKFSQVIAASNATQDHYQRRLDRTHNRYLKSIKTLATVRELALPTLLAIKADIHVTNPAPRL